MNIFVVRIDHGNGYINYYQPSTIEKVNNFAKKRGIEKLIIRFNNSPEYKELTLKQLNQLN